MPSRPTPSSTPAFLASPAFYERVLEALPAQLAVFSPDCRYQYATPSAIRDPELRQWLVGKTDLDYGALRNLPTEVVERRMATIRRVVETKEERTFEESFTTRTGEVRHFRRFVTPVLDVEGTVLHVLGFGIDITEQRRAEEQVQHAQKMEAIGRLAGGVAHDFNNLLTVIGGYADCLKDTTLDDDQRSMLQAIGEAADRGSDLTRQLLAMSRKAASRPTVFHLREMVENTTQMLRRLLSERIAIRLDIDPETPAVRADVGQLKQVLMNLVVNARDAMPEGGLLTISTAPHHVGPADFNPARGVPTGRYTELRVTDSGLGMDADLKARIFEPFFTTKEVGKGTGLGLSTVYGIVKQSAGHVFVESAPGAGSSFFVLLPAVEASPDGVQSAGD